MPKQQSLLTFLPGVYDILSSDDFTVANCENVFTDQNLPETPKDYSPAYWYRSPKKNAAIFTAGSIDIISLANNHTNDYGKTGMADTISALEAENLIWGNTGNPVIIEKCRPENCHYDGRYVGRVPHCGFVKSNSCA